MFRLLVVEDEDMIRNKILNNINWRDNGFEEIYEACDGLQALEIIKSHEMDIVITDIQMPKMDGIELIRELKNVDKRIRTIVISGHAEFEYAKESIKLNVDDYILKPFISKNLLETVNRIKEEIIRERLQNVEIDNLRKQLRENKKQLRDKLFNDLLNDNFIGNIENDIKYLELTHISNIPYFVVVMNIDSLVDIIRTEDEEQKYIFNLSLFNWVDKYFSKFDAEKEISPDFQSTAYVVNYKIDQIVVVCYSDLDVMTPFLEGLIGKINEEIGLRITIGIGNTYFNPRDMYISYKEASSAAMLSFIHGRGIVYTFNDMNFENKIYSRQLHALVNNKLYEDLKVGAFEEIKKDIASIITDLKSAMLGIDSVNAVVNSIFLLTYKTINEMGYNITEIFGGEFNPYINIRGVVGIAQLEEWFFDFFYKINEFINKKRNNRNKALMDKLKEYVDVNFYENISLTSLSKTFNISMGYLSILFNNYIGRNFIDYLTDLRISKAKELLKNSDLRVYEIAEKVGYRDAYYFSAAFKKVVGVNPSDYRESLTSGPNKAE